MFDGFKLSYNWLIVENKVRLYYMQKNNKIRIIWLKNLRISKPRQECSIESNRQTKNS